MAILAAPVVLSAGHDVSRFESESPALDEWLARHALQAIASQSSRTYVVCEGEVVVGYYSLAYGGVQRDEAPTRVAKGMPRHPIPVMLLARLCVARSHERRGIGSSMLRSAIVQALQAAEIAGLRAMLVHAKHETARAFYVKFGFEPSPLDPFQLLLLLKDARKTLSLR